MRTYPKNISKKKIICYVTALVIALAAGLITKLVYKPELPADGKLYVTFIDVDQGDATLIKTPQGETILVDGGEYNIYETHLEPYLIENGIQSVDYAVATHYHSDHMGGIYELVEAGGAKNLIIPDYKDTDDTRSKLEKLAGKMGTKVELMSAGDELETKTQGLKIQAIHPQQGGSDGSNFHNNSSIVLKITYGKTVLLITGDIESRAEKEIVGEYDVECDILKVAHHGSSSSSSKRFMEAADPTYAVISAGKDNSYGHPHTEVVSRLEDDDVRIFRTDVDGSITFVIGADKIEDIKYTK